MSGTPKTPPLKAVTEKEKPLTGDIFLENSDDSTSVYMYLGTSLKTYDKQLYIDITGETEKGHMPPPVILDETTVSNLIKQINPVDFVINSEFNIGHGKNYITIKRLGAFKLNDDNRAIFNKLEKRIWIIIQSYILDAPTFDIENTIKKAGYLCNILNKLTRNPNFHAICNISGGSKTRRNRRSSRKTRMSRRN